MTRMITPYMNPLANGLKMAYRQGRSAIDILPTIQNSIQYDQTKQLILIDLSRAFGSIGRNTLRAILYRQGIPWGVIKQIKMWHMGNKLCAKHDGGIGRGIYNNKVCSKEALSAIFLSSYTLIKLYINTVSSYPKTSNVARPKLRPERNMLNLRGQRNRR